MENRTMWMWHYTVDGRHPAPPFGSIKPVVNNGMFTYIYHINWCRISEPSTVSTVPTYDLEKPTTTLSPLRGKIQIQATHLSAKIEVQVSFDILFVRQWYKQKNNPAKRSMISIDIPWTLTWVFSKKKEQLPSSWWSGEDIVTTRGICPTNPHHTIPSLFQLCGARFGLTNEGPTVRGQATTGGHILGTWHDWDGALEDMGVSKN